MLIRILHSFQNRSLNIIMEHSYNGFIGHQVELKLSTHGLVSNVLDCNLKASLNFSRVIMLAFRLIPLEKAQTPLSPPTSGLNSTTSVLQGWLWH